MEYAIDNALFQWEEGERRLREAPSAERARLEKGVSTLLEELRRRLGSSFTVDELASFYGAGVDWASEIAYRESRRADSAWLVDAAFARYAREAANYAGGRRRTV